MDKSIDFLTYFDNYKCTYTCDEDRQTECQYAGYECLNCSYFKKN